MSKSLLPVHIFLQNQLGNVCTKIHHMSCPPEAHIYGQSRATNECLNTKKTANVCDIPSLFFLSFCSVRGKRSLVLLTVGCGGGRLRTCSCLGVYKIIGAGRNVFSAIIICSLVRAERGIIFFTASCVSELLGLLEDAERFGHIARDCNNCRKWIFWREYSPACTHRAKLPVFWFTVSHGPIFFWK